MPMTGTFVADFSAVGAEAQKAQVFLDALTGTAGNTGKAFDSMVNRFTGAKVISEATQMAAVFDTAGGAAKFTAGELAEMGRTGAEAAEKLRALGLEVPAGIERIATATKSVGVASDGTTPKINSLHGAMGQFDGLLAAAGVHMGPEIRGLGELGDAAGKTAGEVGLLGTAGLVFGAAIGGWKIGRLVADFFDLDTKIGNATAKLLGFGDVAAETAGAKADILANASIKAGRAITDMGEALRIMQTPLKDWRSNLEISAAWVTTWQGEIAKVQAKGDLKSLTADLESQNFSLKDLEKRYGISAEALQYFARETKKAADVSQAAAEQIKKDHEAAAAATAKLTAEIEKLEHGIKLTADSFGNASYEELNFVKVSTTGFATLEAAQKKLADFTAKEALSNTDYQILKIWEVVDEQEKAFIGTTEQRKQYNAAVEDLATAQAQSIRDLADAAAAATETAAGREVKAIATVTQGYYAQIDAMVKADPNAIAVGNRPGEGTNPVNTGEYERGPKVNQGGGALAMPASDGLTPMWGGTQGAPGSWQAFYAAALKGPGFTHKAGGPVSEGPAYLHDNEYVVPQGGALVSRGGGGVTILAPITIQGSVIAERELIQRTSDAITKRVLQGVKVSA